MKITSTSQSCSQIWAGQSVCANSLARRNINIFTQTAKSVAR